MKIIKIVIITFLLVFLFIYGVDPYNLRSDIFLFEKPREFVYNIIYFNRHHKYEYVLFGASSTFLLFNQHIFNEYTKSNAASLCVQHISPENQFEILKYFLKLHPETKKVFVGIEIPQYSDEYETADNIMNHEEESLFKKFTQIYFSYDSLKCSFIKLYFALMKFYDKKIDNKQHQFYRIFPNRQFNFKTSDVSRHTEILKTMQDYFDKNGIQATFFITNVHTNFIVQAKNTGFYQEIEKLKLSMAATLPEFYDTAFVSQYSTTPEFFWHDVVHPWCYMENDMLDVMINKKVNDNLAIKVNKDNVNTILEKQNKTIISYMENHKELVNKLKNEKNFEEYQKVYFKNLPQEIFDKYTDYLY